MSHDGSDVPLHPDAWRIENGGQSGDGAENIRAGLSSPIMYVITGIRDLRWYAEGSDVVAVYFLDTVTSPTYIVERFRVDDDGLITEIEANFYIDIPGYAQGPESVSTNPSGQEERLTASSHGPAGPASVLPGNRGDDSPRPASSCDRDCVADAVDAWFAAVVTHDASGVPIADDASQTVNRRAVAATGAEMRALLESRQRDRRRARRPGVDRRPGSGGALRARAGGRRHVLLGRAVLGGRRPDRRGRGGVRRRRALHGCVGTEMGWGWTDNVERVRWSWRSPRSHR